MQVGELDGTLCWRIGVSSMIPSSLRDAVVREFERLGTADQLRVMDFVRALGTAQPRGTPGRELARFSGAFSESAVDEMMTAIEEGCERIDEEW
jgi:hypothetical protein